MKAQILFTADLGEHEIASGSDQVDVDAAIIPLINMASIACGGHAGNAEIMSRAVSLAMKHKVDIGAHPGYPDKANFGRVSMAISADVLKESVQQQVEALQDVCQQQAAKLSYIKPHGALYNDSVNSAEIRAVLLAVAKEFELPLVTLAGPANQKMHAEAAEQGVELILEAFADRRYLDSGELKPRSLAGAVLEQTVDVVEQAKMIAQQNSVVSDSGSVINLAADCICLHGDNPESISLANDLNETLR